MTSARPKIDFDAKIPNNVDLASDRKLQRALERWQPNFLDWWGDMGPAVDTKDVYLRTAVDVGREGWAHFDHVPMNEYRWGVFLSEHDPDRKIAFGDQKSIPNVECDSIDEACTWAAKIPAARHGAIEVRPVYVDSSSEEGAEQS